VKQITEEEKDKLRKDKDVCPRCGKKLTQIGSYFDHALCTAVVVLECSNAQCDFEVCIS
jgi:hypothetical protein